MKKKWRMLLLAAALPLVLCGCMMSASVDDSRSSYRTECMAVPLPSMTAACW
mgnify:CR=1 FL=1